MSAAEAMVLDASITLTWLFEDELDARAERVLGSLSQLRPFAPTTWALETAHGILRAQRLKRIDGSKAHALSTQLMALNVILIPIQTFEAHVPVIELAERHNISIYDASYIHVAQTMNLPLATLDQTQARAAAAAGVTLCA